MAQKYYRKSLVHRCRLSYDNMKKYDIFLLDAINLKAEAWHQLRLQMIANCFTHAAFSRAPESIEENSGAEFSGCDEVCSQVLKAIGSQGSPMPPVMNSRSVPPVVRLDLLLEGLTTGASLLPSLRAHYHMGPLTGSGCTGSQARFTVHLPQHSLSFNTKVPPACEANLPSRASVELPPVQVAAEYLQDPGGPSQRDADGVVLRRGSYLSALAEIGTFEHSLTTDLLNHLVLVQKVFMKVMCLLLPT
ncbi:hypothetical protein HPB51_013100 [Rhipicephalus microplus]|uniref:Uncharacterized protein n=1 Tax=Rhipicephalus microplus TaxID=6941 RepID=A0A9J6F2F0_RHIMP|nr:hypothetical protein HPB51_013100 [Rhipicephalus microplus]